MSIDWSRLSADTSSYRALHAPRLDGRVTSAVFCGLRATLGELVSLFPPGGGTSLAIFADSLVVDRPSFDASGVVVVARSIDVSMLGGEALLVGRPAPGRMAVTELLVGECVGGPLRLRPSGAPEGMAAFQVPTGTDPLGTAYFVLSDEGLVTTTEPPDPAHVKDVLGVTWALNGLRASLTAASRLVDSSDREARDTACSMLGWVAACARSMRAGDGSFPADFAELYANAVALLTTIDLPPGARYVPVLSPRFYLTHCDVLLDALSEHERHAATLQTETHLREAIASVGSALGDVAGMEVAPLDVQLDACEQNLAGLARDIVALSSELEAQRVAADVRLDVLIAAFKGRKAFEAAMATLGVIANAWKAAASMGLGGGAGGFRSAEWEKAPWGGDREEGDALGAVFAALASCKKFYDAVTAEAPDRELLKRAVELMKMESALMTAFASARALWNERPDRAAAAVAPGTLSVDLADPTLAWDNYVVEAERALANVKEAIGPGAAAVQAAANNYLATLKIMAQYGKALAAKFVAAASVAAQGALLRSQRLAARATQERWKQLEASARSDLERAAALKGIVQVRMDGIKRTLFAAWVNFRNAFFYLHLQEPPKAIDLGMDAAALRLAFARVRDWVDGLRGDTPEARLVRLPDDDVCVSYTFPIRRPEDTTGAAAGTALLTSRTDATPPSLTWTIPTDDAQMAGVLPDGGRVAMWIKEASFFVEGVTPNAKGNVIAEVSTSGAYQNGFGPAASHAFVAKGLAGHYAYEARGGRVYNPWVVKTDVYCTPTPFTQWRLVFDPDGGDPEPATALRMELKVAYLARADVDARATP